jgi:hypothetical protein
MLSGWPKPRGRLLIQSFGPGFMSDEIKASHFYPVPIVHAAPQFL